MILKLALALSLLMDWSQTHYIARHPERFSEGNPLLGSHPSSAAIDAYFLGTGAAIMLANKKWLSIGVLSLEGVVVARNARIGIGFAF